MLKVPKLYTYRSTFWTDLIGKNSFLHSFLTSKEHAIRIIHDIARSILMTIFTFIIGGEIILISMRALYPTSGIVDRNLIYSIFLGMYSKNFDT